MRPPAAVLSFQQLVSLSRALVIPSEFAAVPGWLSDQEQRALYAFAYILDGPFLEIGAWVGKSTTTIAKAIRDAGYYKKFVTSELNPTLADFRPHNGKMGYFPNPLSDESYAMVNMKSWTEEVEPVLSGPGGVVGALRRNLARLELDDLVEIAVGDLLEAPRLEYKFIFSDWMHHRQGYAGGLAALRTIINGRGCILAAHYSFPEDEIFLRENLPILDGIRIDTLFVCQVAPEPSA